MEELKILIVEDDKAIYDDVYKTNIDLFNRENEEYQINQLWIQSKDEAIVALKNSENIFDGAIVDLDLIGSGGTDTSGIQRFTPGGSIAGAVSIPTRHIHQVIEMADKKDIEGSIKLLKHCIEDISDFNWKQ